MDCLIESVRTGTDVLARCWPEGLAEVRRSIQVIIPLRGEGLSPMNASLSEFRGMLGTTARPSYLCSQSLVHEAGHNRLDTLLDLVVLAENSPSELYGSPFVKAPRPMSRIFHGALAFLQDVVASHNFRGKVTELPGWELDPYIDRMALLVEDGLSVIRTHARLTEAGERFTQRIADVVREYR